MTYQTTAPAAPANPTRFEAGTRVSFTYDGTIAWYGIVRRVIPAGEHLGTPWFNISQDYDAYDILTDAGGIICIGCEGVNTSGTLERLEDQMSPTARKWCRQVFNSLQGANRDEGWWIDVAQLAEQLEGHDDAESLRVLRDLDGMAQAARSRR